jgi:hypothetical protein
MSQPVTESEGESALTARTKPVRMRRSPGGRHRQLGVRLTEEEERLIRNRAEEAGLSAQRLLVEAALSGSAQSAAARRHAAVEVRAARVILKGVANNLKQLAKWANANDVLPANLDRLMSDLARAVQAVEQTVRALGIAFESSDQVRGRGDTEVSS